MVYEELPEGRKLPDRLSLYRGKPVLPKDPTPEQIRTWIKFYQRNPTGYSHPNWPGDLWRRKYDEIVEFLIERFQTTLDKAEYYGCMLYLTKDIPESELFVPFEKSPQCSVCPSPSIPFPNNVAIQPYTMAKTRHVMPTKE